MYKIYQILKNRQCRAVIPCDKGDKKCVHNHSGFLPDFTLQTQTRKLNANWGQLSPSREREKTEVILGAVRDQFGVPIGYEEVLEICLGVHLMFSPSTKLKIYRSRLQKAWQKTSLVGCQSPGDSAFHSVLGHTPQQGRVDKGLWMTWTLIWDPGRATP